MSLFEFLNPGMLGEAKVSTWRAAWRAIPRRCPPHPRASAAPFILRRNKQQVARELPEKTEQTIYCEPEGPQKKQYDELRKHYRETPLARVQSQGIANRRCTC